MNSADAYSSTSHLLHTVTRNRKHSGRRWHAIVIKKFAVLDQPPVLCCVNYWTRCWHRRPICSTHHFICLLGHFKDYKPLIYTLCEGVVCCRGLHWWCVLPGFICWQVIKECKITQCEERSGIMVTAWQISDIIKAISWLKQIKSEQI